MRRVHAPGEGKTIAISASLAQAKRIGRVLGELGYRSRLASSEQDLRRAAVDNSISLIVVEGEDQDWELANLLMRMHESYGAGMPPILAITVDDPRGPAWLPSVKGPTIFYFPKGHADDALPVIVD